MSCSTRQSDTEVLAKKLVVLVERQRKVEGPQKTAQTIPVRWSSGMEPPSRLRKDDQDANSSSSKHPRVRSLADEISATEEKIRHMQAVGDAENITALHMVLKGLKKAQVGLNAEVKVEAADTHIGFDH